MVASTKDDSACGCGCCAILVVGAALVALGWVSDHPFIAAAIILVIVLVGVLALIGSREAKREEIEKSKKAMASAEQELARSRAVQNEVVLQETKRAAESDSAKDQERQETLARLREQAERLAREIRDLQEGEHPYDGEIGLIEHRGALSLALHELEDRIDLPGNVIEGKLAVPRTAPPSPLTELGEIEEVDLWDFPVHSPSPDRPSVPDASSPPGETPWARITPGDLLRLVCDLLDGEGWRTATEPVSGTKSENVSILQKDDIVIGVWVLRNKREAGSKSEVLEVQSLCTEHRLNAVLAVSRGTVGDVIRSELGRSDVMAHVIDADLLTQWNSGHLIFAMGEGLVDDPL